MEEFDDDDFSDLYADVEVKACSAINFMHETTQVSSGNDVFSDNVVEKEQMDCETCAAENIRNHSNVTGSENRENIGGREWENRSECEDDLNIVLNDEDGGGENYDRNNNYYNERDEQIDEEEKNGNGKDSSGQGQHGSGEKGKALNSHPRRKYPRPHSASFSTNSKDSCSSRVYRKNNEYSQSERRCPIVAQIGNNFSLTRSRTILGINIDSLEKKPWSSPGADVTDFFNFGFDEDSWKQYRNDLEKYQDQIIMTKTTAVHELPMHMKDFECGSGHEEIAQASLTKNAQSRPKRRVSSAPKIYDRDQGSELANGRSFQAKDNMGRHEQDLKEDYLNSLTKTIDQTFSQMHATCENGDTVVEDDDVGLLHFSISIGDEHSSFEENDAGRGKTTSERYSSCIPACDPASLDLDKYGSVQISDSEEDSHYDASICESDGISQAKETSGSTNKSYARNVSDKTPSTAESESSDSGQSQHAPSLSPSHCAGLSDKYLEKSLKHSKNPLPNPVSKLRESVTCDYHPNKEPKTCGIIANPRHSRCFRSKGTIRKDLKMHRRSDDPSKLKTHFNDEDGFHVSDAKRIYDLHHSTVSHDKQSFTLDNFDSNVRKDIFYCKRSDHFSPYFDEVFPDYQFGPAYMKNLYWNIHPSFGYELGWYDSRDMNEKQTFIKGKQSKVDSNAVDQDRHYGRKRADQDIDSHGFEESRHFIPKYSAYIENGGGNQFNRKGDGMQVKRRIKRVKFIPVRNYKRNFVHGKNRRFMPIGDRDTDHLESKYDHSLSYNRRKIKSPGRRGKWRCDSPLNGFDNSWCTDSDDDYGRCIRRQHLSYKEPQAPRGGRYQSAAGPKSCLPQTHGRRMRSSQTERFRGSGRSGSYSNKFETAGDIQDLHGQDHFVRSRRYQQSIHAFDTNEGIKKNHHDHLFRRRHYQQSKVLDWNEEEYTSRQQDDVVFHSKGPKYPLERISNHINFDATQGYDCLVKLMDKRQVDRRRYELNRECNPSSQFNQSSNFIHPENCCQTHPRCWDSVYPHFVGERKLSRRNSGAERTMRYDRHDYMDWNSDPEQEIPTGLNDSGSEKAALAKTEKADTNLGDKSWNKFPDTQQNEYLDIEEGQIISDEIDEKSVEIEIASEVMTQVDCTEYTGTSSNGNTVVGGIIDLRIQEIIAKMEKRRERFKDPITFNKDAENTSKHLVELDVETAETWLKKPVRKRKWVGN